MVHQYGHSYLFINYKVNDHGYSTNANMLSGKTILFRGRVCSSQNILTYKGTLGQTWKCSEKIYK